VRHDSPHYRLIASALTGGPQQPSSDWNWDRTVDVAAREEVLPSLYTRLSCPPEVSDFFEAIHELNAERNRQLLAEVEALALLLNNAGIEPVLLKGAAYLAAGLYPDPADRLLQDIDFLVEPSVSRQAFGIVEGAGYEPYTPNPTALVLHHYPALTQLHKVPVEIHHAIGSGACAEILPAKEIIESSTLLHLGAARVRVPSPEHLITHLIVHSQMQHGGYYRIWPPLRAMFDLLLLDRRFPTAWDAVRNRFQAHGRAGLLNLHLMQVEKALGMAPPFPIPNGGIRWFYRRALWRAPRLKHIDPCYTFSRMVLPKIRLSWRLLRHPAGRKYVLLRPFRPRFYKRLLTDLVQG
jgi:hypothetical protein